MNKFIFAIAIIGALALIFFVYAQFGNSNDASKADKNILPVEPHDNEYRANNSKSSNIEALPANAQTQALAQAPALTLPELFARTEASVVQVADRSQSNPEESSLGSGFVYDTSGHIVTNSHVISGKKNGLLDVTFPDGTVYSAKLTGYDPFTDLAVLQVENVPKDKLVPLPLSNSSKIRIGDQVAAIGNPFGLSGSMSTGIVSGLGRLLPVAQQGSNSQNTGSVPSFSIPDVIQTDASINPGNSGGPLLNMRGEVIGINSAILSSTGQFAGVGLAIPSNTMAKVVPSLIMNGSYTHPWLGVSGANMTPGIAKMVGLKEPKGFLVIDVIKGSPAEKAGIRGGDKPANVDGRDIPLGGDVILGIDNKDVRKIEDILGYMESSKKVGDSLDLTVFRDAGIQKINVILGTRPSSLESP